LAASKVIPNGLSVGAWVQLKEQDRSALAEAHDMIIDCLRAGPSGRYVLQAAIASP